MTTLLTSTALGAHRRWTAAASAVAIALAGLVATAVPARADGNPMSVTLTPSATSVASGSQLTFTIDALNDPGARADEVTMTFQAPNMTNLVLTSNVGSCSQSDDLVTCDAGSLDGFQPWQVTVRGTVTAPAGTTINATATVTGTRSSQTFTVSSTASVLVAAGSTGPKPDLSVGIQAPTLVGPDQAVTYQLTVNNAGGVKASEITLINTLPLGFTYTGYQAAGTSLFACSAVGITVTCTGGAVNDGSNATISISAKAPAALFGPSYDTAVVDPYDEIDESNEENNTASSRSDPPAPPAQTGFSITKTDTPDPLRPGDLLKYVIVGTNIAATRADSVSIVDGTTGLDAASVQASYQINGGTSVPCTVAASQVTCTRRSPTLRLDPGQTMTVTVVGKVVASAGSIITNTATISGNIKNKGVKQTASAVTTVRPGVDLTVVQHAIPVYGEFRARDGYEYEITVGNSGLDTAENVRLRLPLPDGVLYKGFSSTGGGGCSLILPSRVVECSGLTVRGVNDSGQPWGSIEKITLEVIAPPYTGAINATVTVDPANTIFEADETNNTYTTRTVILTGIDLTVAKDSNSPVATSGTLVYAITVTNLGTQDSTGIKVVDTLPAGTRFREVTGDKNFTCSHDGSASGGQVTCIGGNLRGTTDTGIPLERFLPPDEATITLTVFAPAAPGYYKNQVRVDPDLAIPEILEDNNINTFTTQVVVWDPVGPPADSLGAFHELTVEKSQAFPPGDVAPSGVLEYDLDVKNWGSDVAVGVVVQDTIPAGATFRYAVDAAAPQAGAFTCTHSSGVITCVGGTLDGTTGQTVLLGDQTRTIHVGLFAPTQPGDYTNQSVVDPNNAIPEANETNNTDTITTTVAIGGGGPYIELDVDSIQTAPSAAPGPAVVPNGTLTYELKVRNTGTAVAFNVSVRDVLPTGARFRSATDSLPGPGAFTCAESGGVVTCAGGTLDGTNGDTPLGGDTVRTITINVFAPPHPGGYTNQAEVDPGNAIAENDETNNTDQTTTLVSLSGGGNFTDLRVPTVASSTTDPSPGQEYTYTITVDNTGTDVAFDVALRTVLDPALTYVKTVSDNDFVCGFSGGVLGCTGGALDGLNDQDPTHDSVAVISVTVKAPLLHSYDATLQTRADPDSSIPEAIESNNSNALSVTVTSKVDLQVDVADASLSSATEGDWEFTAKNTGSEAASNVTVEFDLAVGTIPLNVQAPNASWSCQITENPISEVTCTTASLGAGANDTFTVHLYTTAQGETIHSSAVIDPANVVVESNENNNTDQGSSSV
jgi:uncharacterized repeat protein (TIGR01451 family)